MPESITIADASPIIAPEDIGELHILQQLYGEILITDIVREEIQADLPEWFKVTNEYDKNNFKTLGIQLDAGEASAIALAVKTSDCKLIIDERKGRRVARLLGIKTVGVLGLILKAKQSGVISSGTTLLEKLEDHGFWLSEKLKLQLVQKMGE